jgi:hydroxymethylglutaryl-CoA lyase
VVSQVTGEENYGTGEHMKQITIAEVGPRDGFQNVSEYIPLEDKLQIIHAIMASGVQHVQITSFVSPKAIPQMKDARELAEICLERYGDRHLFALVPNYRGAQAAWDVGIRRVSYVVSLSESHNRANINRTHEQSLQELHTIRTELPDLEVVLDLATAFGCPFEGEKHADEVVHFLAPYAQRGITAVNLCDTIGIAHPVQVRRTIEAVQREYPKLPIHLHIHDTRNMGMVNTLAGIELGIQEVQSTLGGLGGCPYAPGASGNLATEDLVYMLNRMGYETGIDTKALIAAAHVQAKLVPQGKYSGHMQNIQEDISHD